MLERQIQDLPLNGRNPLTLAGLQAGVSSAGAGTRTASVNGLRGTFTNLTWDGININDNFIRTDSFFGVAAPSVASVSEFTLTTQNAGAADGLGVAQVKLITPRGGNEYHGSFFEYHRNDVFDANTFFNNAAGRFVAGEAAVVAGRAAGRRPAAAQAQADPEPVRLQHRRPDARARASARAATALWGRDKLFFYFFYEGTRTAQEGSRHAHLPDAETRATGSSPTARPAPTRHNLCPAGISPGQLVTVNLLALCGQGRRPDHLGAGTQRAAAERPDHARPGERRRRRPAVELRHLPLQLAARQHQRPLGLPHRLRPQPEPPLRGDLQPLHLRVPELRRRAVPRRPRRRPKLGAPARLVRVELDADLELEQRAALRLQPLRRAVLHQRARSTAATASSSRSSPTRRITSSRRAAIVKTYDLIDNATWVKGNHTFSFGGNYRNNYIEPFNDAGIIPTFTIGFSATGTPNPLATSASSPAASAPPNSTRRADVLAILTGPISQGTQTFNAANRTDGYVPGATQRQQFKLLQPRRLRAGQLAHPAQPDLQPRPALRVHLGAARAAGPRRCCRPTPS